MIDCNPTVQLSSSSASPGFDQFFFEGYFAAPQRARQLQPDFCLLVCLFFVIQIEKLYSASCVVEKANYVLFLFSSLSVSFLLFFSVFLASFLFAPACFMCIPSCESLCLYACQCPFFSLFFTCVWVRWLKLKPVLQSRLSVDKMTRFWFLVFGY